MSRQSAHFNKVNSAIQAALNEASSKGLLGSGALCKHLCSLQLKLFREYAESEYSYALNDIKSRKIEAPTITDFSSLAKTQIIAAIKIHQDILDKEIHRTLGHKDGRSDRISQELDFENKAKNILSDVSNKFEADYSEYREQKNRDEQSLNIAKEANRISKRNFWITSIISLLALVVSIISLYSTYSRK